MTSDLNAAVDRYDQAGSRSIADRLVEVYADVYAEHLDDPFFSVERFAERLARHQSAVSHELVTASCDGSIIGYAYGAALAADTRWWDGLLGDVSAESVRETGSRTFALNEIMVRESWRRRGVARKLHDALLARRSEERATLLVEPGNVPAKAAYTSWGWQFNGHLQPFPDAPVYDSMLIGLGDHKPDITDSD